MGPVGWVHGMGYLISFRPLQTAMAVTQQKQQKYVDKFKVQTPKYKKKKKIWLTLKNLTTATENKKFDAKQVKYTSFEDMGFHNFRLNTPPSIRNVFHGSIHCVQL